jgi:hypothetical protein
MTHTDQCVSDHQAGHVGLSAVPDVVGSWAVTHYGVEHPIGTSTDGTTCTRMASSLTMLDPDALTHMPSVPAGNVLIRR